MGDLVFFFEVDEIDQYKDLSAVFIEISGELIPFAIQRLQFKNDRFGIVKLEDVDDNEEALALTGNELYLPLSYLPVLKGNQFYYHEVIGFMVKDIKFGNVGIIDHIIDQTSQPLFVILHKKKEILIPVADEIIKKVDRKNKVIEVETPEGLIDLYL